MREHARETVKAPLVGRARQLLFPAFVALALLILWEGVGALANVPAVILPRPSLIGRLIGQRWELLLKHAYPTTVQSILGFLCAVVVGVGLGMLVSFSRFFREAVYPLIIAFQVVPKVALAPVFILWFGLGGTSRLVLAFFIAFFPMVVNTFTGLDSVDPTMIRMARAFHASRFTIFWKIQLPHAMPYIFSGLKISITFAVIGIVVAEFVTAQEGLGYLIVFSEGNLDTPMMMGSLVVLSVVGILLYGAVVGLEKLCIWWEPERGT